MVYFSRKLLYISNIDNRSQTHDLSLKNILRQPLDPHSHHHCNEPSIHLHKFNMNLKIYKLKSLTPDFLLVQILQNPPTWLLPYPRAKYWRPWCLCASCPWSANRPALATSRGRWKRSASPAADPWLKKINCLWIENKFSSEMGELTYSWQGTVVGVAIFAVNDWYKNNFVFDHFMKLSKV